MIAPSRDAIIAVGRNLQPFDAMIAIANLHYPLHQVHQMPLHLVHPLHQMPCIHCTKCVFSKCETRSWRFESGFSNRFSNSASIHCVTIMSLEQQSNAPGNSVSIQHILHQCSNREMHLIAAYQSNQLLGTAFAWKKWGCRLLVVC